MSRIRSFTVDVEEPLPSVGDDPERYDLLTKETVVMTVLAQDPSIVDRRRARAAPGSRCPPSGSSAGPRGHRFHVVDVNVGSGKAAAPVVLHDGDAWTYRDRFTAAAHPERR